MNANSTRNSFTRVISANFFTEMGSILSYDSTSFISSLLKPLNENSLVNLFNYLSQLSQRAGLNCNNEGFPLDTFSIFYTPRNLSISPRSIAWSKPGFNFNNIPNINL